MSSWLGRGFWKWRGGDRSRHLRVRKPSSRSTLRTEALEDRLLPSLSATLLLDVNPGSANSNSNSFTPVNGLVYFSAVDEHGRELWASDGTAAGTYLVKDINPGTTSSNPYYLTNVSGTLFFSANDGIHGIELWRSNGTAAGTTLVQDIHPGPNYSYPGRLTNVNGTLFFTADDGTHGGELWESNGTAAGTFLVKDINPGSNNSYPFSFTNVNGTLFFTANDGTHGGELWESNGTAAGTFMVRDINPNQFSGGPTSLTNMNGTLFFAASDGVHGNELWKSNGAMAGTEMVADINPGGADSYPGQLTNVNGTLFFQANNGTNGSELWRSEGTAAGTHMVQDINPGSGSSYLAFMTNVNGTAFFAASDGAHGNELWASNGTAAGTFLVQDINSGPSGSNPAYLTNVSDTVFFQADDGTHGSELWASNGAAAGTFLVQDIKPSSPSSFPHNLTSINGSLLFSADDGTHGVEPWIVPVSTAPTTTVTSSPNPSVFGQPVTFTATVSVAPGSGTPTGTVDFKEGSNDLTPGGVTLAGSQATFSTAALAVGSNTITAVYSGDGTFSSGQGDDSASPQVVNKSQSATSLAVVSGASVFGQPVDFIAFVAAVLPGAGTPTGHVTFKEGSTTLAAHVNVAGGHAGFSIASLPVGAHTITAIYFGDGDFMASSTSRIQVVSKASTSTTLASSPNPSVFGQGVVFTAIVQAAAPSGGTPAGTVDFKEGATDLTPGGITLVGGRASFITAALAVGHHTVTAIYSGNASFSASQRDDSGAPQVVDQASSRTVLASFPRPTVFGEVVSFTVVVPALPLGRGTPTGTVTFTDGTRTIGSVSLSGGRATFTTASLSTGNHAINAKYGGDGNFLVSSDTNFGQPVLKDATNTTVTASLNPVVTGLPVTFTARVQASVPGNGTPTGTVTFKDITTVLGTGTLTGAGQATFSTSGLAVGTHAITATYGGDNNFTSSVSPILAETVKAAAATLAVSPGPDSGNPASPVLVQSSQPHVLSAQSLDVFFSPVGIRRSNPAPRGVRLRRIVSASDWLERSS
jgi:ELWxxDGT repeat protein